MKRFKGLIITIAIILILFGCVWMMDTGITLLPGRGPVDANIVGFHYSNGSYFGGYYDYEITKVGDDVRFVATGGNGVDLDVNKTIDAAVLDELAEVINSHGIYSWDGFHKSDKNVMDGFSFRLEVVYDNGKTIEAGGYEKYPANFDYGHEALKAFFDKLCLEDALETGKIEIGDTPEDLYQAFLNGWISAVRITEDGQEQAFMYSDLQQSAKSWENYEEHPTRVDLDNDGEEELRLIGPYGGMYLDARDGKVYVLGESDSFERELCFADYDGVTYIIHKNAYLRGTYIYNFEEYNGNGEVVDSFTLSGIYAEDDHDPETVVDEFTFKGSKITREEFEKLEHEIFGV